MTTIDHDTLLDLCSGNGHAVSLIEGVWEFVEMYDDLVDGDRHPESDVHRSMDFVLFGLHANPCYHANPVLQHSLRHMIILWRAANSMERTQEPDALNISYTLRCSPFNFFVSVVLCVSGAEKAIRAAEMFYNPNDDDALSGYMLEHVRKD